MTNSEKLFETLKFHQNRNKLKMKNLVMVPTTVSQMHRPRPTAPSGLTDYLPLRHEIHGLSLQKRLRPAAFRRAIFSRLTATSGRTVSCH
jgi:hypothetical protein